ncbi:hypothetical protein [Francisella philomiragia]|uniref:hypothetical protein n=1 Tax=Francisella philomiragia TaxID=28110 RepID=UPI0005A575F8|nr:hypothetical protein [Francisella philomiragia]AJI56073.1 hypothetical protein LA56_294 [Francisella philomiragia]MBK2093473.1 hypothetical protein [Francisella philomiragia]MBK2252503.1 hypothetical protein [Francisella philomiragia]MBK2255943.1 hypothetical protein [Francisella philomiragia]MBK2268601.1 hypothetical protein [Francisella philomiragia]
MKNKILVVWILLFSLSGVSFASYTVLDDKGKAITYCDDLEVEKDNQDRFSRAVFSKCRNGEVFSYTGNFRYQER